MVDLPANGEGLNWIARRDPTKLLLIPGLHISSIVAAAAGDQQALAYVRFTAQHFAAYACTRNLNPLDRACLAACKANDLVAGHEFLTTLRKKDPQLAKVFQTRRAFTSKLFDEAACAGEVSAMKWIRAICPRTYGSEGTKLMMHAALNGQLEVLKYLRSGPNPTDWDEETAADASRHMDCITWVLSTDCPYEDSILRNVARHLGLPALQWFRANQELPAELWNDGLLAEAAGKHDRPMLEWLRALSPPIPWSEKVTQAAAGKDLSLLQWLRAQDPPCPWNSRSCYAAACSGKLDILVWLRGQDPPCPWDLECIDVAARFSNPEVLQWLHDNGCPFGPHTATSAAARGDLPLLKRLHSAGCPLDSECTRYAARSGHLQVLKWLCDQGCQLTCDLYVKAASRRQNHILRYLHSMKVSPTGADTSFMSCCSRALPTLMFFSDVGIQLSAEGQRLVMQARRSCCTFHGLIRWCRRAISDPSRGSHRAFDFRTEDSSGQLLLTRMCLLPPELIIKIAVAAELQHDIFESSV